MLKLELNVNTCTMVGEPNSMGGIIWAVSVFPDVIMLLLSFTVFYRSSETSDDKTGDHVKKPLTHEIYVLYYSYIL